MPSGVRLAVRNDRIVQLSRWLASELPGSSPHRIAALLAAAGRRIETGRGISDAPPFDVLASDERARLATEIKDILEWAPSWPRWRQLFRVLSSNHVAVTGRSARPSAHEHSRDEQTDRRRPRSPPPPPGWPEILEAS
jgi:hypothetical protein